jgi:histone H3/H4
MSLYGDDDSRPTAAPEMEDDDVEEAAAEAVEEAEAEVTSPPIEEAEEAMPAPAEEEKPKKLKKKKLKEKKLKEKEKPKKGLEFKQKKAAPAGAEEAGERKKKKKKKNGLLPSMPEGVAAKRHKSHGKGYAKMLSIYNPTIKRVVYRATAALVPFGCPLPTPPKIPKAAYALGKLAVGAMALSLLKRVTELVVYRRAKTITTRDIVHAANVRSHEHTLPILEQ